MYESQCRTKIMHTRIKQNSTSLQNIIKLTVMALKEGDLELPDKECKTLIDKLDPVSNIWYSFSCNQDSRFQEPRGENGNSATCVTSIDPLEKFWFLFPQHYAIGA